MNRLFAIALLLVVVTNVVAERSPNFIVIFTDDQGYQDVGCFGSPNIKTPNLDQMAGDGMKFTDFYAMAPVCSASRAGLLTGCYPPRVGTVGVYFPNHVKGLNPDEVTIAEVLKPRGYATGCIGKWHLGHHKEFLPSSQGFDYYFGIPYSNDMDPVKKAGKRDLDKHFVDNDISRWNVPLMRNDEIIERPAYQPTLTQRYTEEAVSFIDRHKDEPFFLYLPHTMPHIPIFVSEKFYTDDPSMAYQRCIEEIDWSVGEVLKAVKRHGLDDNTLIVFTTDNGPWLNLKPPHHGGSALPLRAGKFTTYEGGMRVPTIMRWTGKIAAGETCDKVAATFDLMPTLAGLANAQLPDRKIDGKDIWPLMSGESKESPHDAFYYFKGHNKQKFKLHSMRKGKWKLHIGTPARGNRQKVKPPQLYDLSQDISESEDVADQHPVIVSQLVAQAVAFENQMRDEARPEGMLAQ